MWYSETVDFQLVFIWKEKTMKLNSMNRSISRYPHWRNWNLIFLLLVPRTIVLMDSRCQWTVPWMMSIVEVLSVLSPYDFWLVSVFSISVRLQFANIVVKEWKKQSFSSLLQYVRWSVCTRWFSSVQYVRWWPSHGGISVYLLFLLLTSVQHMCLSNLRSVRPQVD